MWGYDLYVTWHRGVIFGFMSETFRTGNPLFLTTPNYLTTRESYLIPHHLCPPYIKSRSWRDVNAQETETWFSKVKRTERKGVYILLVKYNQTWYPLSTINWLDIFVVKVYQVWLFTRTLNKTPRFFVEQHLFVYVHLTQEKDEVNVVDNL